MRVTFRLNQYPEGYTTNFRNVRYGQSSSYDPYFSNNGKTVQTDVFFRGVQSRCVPGEYVYQINVYDITADKTVLTEAVSITYDYVAENVDILADGDDVTNNTNSGSLIMSGGTNKVKFDGALYPRKSTGMQIGTTSSVDPKWYCEWSSSNTSVGTIDENGNFVGLKPGKTTITLKTYHKETISGKSTNVYDYTSTCDLPFRLQALQLKSPN